MKRMWTCRRQIDGQQCRTLNPARKRNCMACGKPRQRDKPPAHRVALDLTYDVYVALNGGDVCGICGSGPSATRRLDRDHDHRTGRPRGLLCHICNRTLGPRVTLEWLQAAQAYLERAAAIDPV